MSTRRVKHSQRYPRTTQDAPYVLHCCTLPGTSSVLFASSDNSIASFESIHPTPVRQCSSKITAIKSYEQEMLLGIATEKEGLQLWDCRKPLSNDPVLCVRGSGGSCLSFDVASEGAALATGTEVSKYEAFVHVWDIRNLNVSAPVHTYTDSHSDDVTTLAFHPQQSHQLLSGSVDGLISIFDVRIADEDDAVLSTGQVGASVLKANWYKAADNVWNCFALTHMETLSLWSTAPELEQIQDLGDLRERLATPSWTASYIIDVLPDGEKLKLFAGSQDGRIAQAKVKSSGKIRLVDITNENEGHNDIVRCIYSKKKDTLWSGGEDGLVCHWESAPQLQQIEDVEMATSEDPASPEKKKRKKEKSSSKRFEPY